MQNQNTEQAKLCIHTCLDVSETLDFMHHNLRLLEQHTKPLLNELKQSIIVSIANQVQFKLRMYHSTLHTFKFLSSADPSLPASDNAHGINTKKKSSVANLLVDFDSLYEDDTMAVTGIKELSENPD